MASKKYDTGIGYYQVKRMLKAKNSIYKALSDGKWHRFTEIKEETKLSSRNLTENLKKSEKAEIIDRKVDKESGKYPVPVLYKAKPFLLTYIKNIARWQKYTEQLDFLLKESKDPLLVLEMQTMRQIHCVQFLEEIKRRTKHKEWNEVADVFLSGNDEFYSTYGNF